MVKLNKIELNVKVTKGEWGDEEDHDMNDPTSRLNAKLH